MGPLALENTNIIANKDLTSFSIFKLFIYILNPLASTYLVNTFESPLTVSVFTNLSGLVFQQSEATI